MHLHCVMLRSAVSWGKAASGYWSVNESTQDTAQAVCKVSGGRVRAFNQRRSQVLTMMILIPELPSSKDTPAVHGGVFDVGEWKT